MTYFIWYENDAGFKITKLHQEPSLEEIATIIPETVDVVELMNAAALKNKIKVTLTDFIRSDVEALAILPDFMY